MSQRPPENPYEMPYDSNRPTVARPKFNGPPPAVMTWQMVYLILMLVVYIALVIGGGCLFAFADDIAAEDPAAEPQMFRIMGVIYGIMGFVLAIVFAVGLFWKRGMGGWIYNIVLIALGLTSCITWPMTIPLLIQWIKHKDWIVGSRTK